MRVYLRVLRKAFGVNKKYKNNPRVMHNIVIADERGFNHPIERLHNTTRERTKIMKGLEINYNFNRKYMSLSGNTPAQFAISHLKLGHNKWLDIIKLSKLTM